MSDKDDFYSQATQFFKHLAFISGTEKHNTPAFSKHRIYIQKYQNGWFITREPLHYDVAGWVAETTEKLHELLDKLIEDIEATPTKPGGK